MENIKVVRIKIATTNNAKIQILSLMEINLQKIIEILYSNFISSLSNSINQNYCQLMNKFKGHIFFYHEKVNFSLFQYQFL